MGFPYGSWTQAQKEGRINATDLAIADFFGESWTNFAKYGLVAISRLIMIFRDPNGDPNDPVSSLPFRWEPVSQEHPRRYLSIKLNSEMRDPFQEGRSEFWLKLKRHMR